MLGTSINGLGNLWHIAAGAEKKLQNLPVVAYFSFSGKMHFLVIFNKNFTTKSKK
jgi:hypothetical protein